MNYAAAFGVRCGEHKARDAGEGDCRRAHRARLQRYKQVVAGDALRAFLAADIANHQNFGMGGGIGQFAGAVAVAGDDFAIGAVDQNRANRHFVPGAGGKGLFHCGLHIDMVILHRG